MFDRRTHATPAPEPAAPGQESAWSYPRPAIARPTDRHVSVRHRGLDLADSRRSVQTLETSHPPSYYFPPGDVLMGALRRSRRRSFCEWKGEAAYFDVVIGDAVLRDVAWTYPDPSPGFVALRDYVAFYPGPLDACFVDGERVVPQPGGFYGGWISSHVAGPFKGGPGTNVW